MNGLRFTDEQLAEILRRAGYAVSKPRRVAPMREQERAQKAAKPAKAKRGLSDALIDRLVADIMRAGHPEPAREHRFDAERKFRFDLAIHCCGPRGGVGVELDGLWATGAHTLPTQAARDREKDALALSRGWLVVRVTPSMVRSGAAMEAIRYAIDIRVGAR